MKKLFATILFLLIFTDCITAQIHFGGTMFSTTVGFKNLSNGDDFTNYTRFGGFVLGRLAIGPLVEFGKTEVVAGPLVNRYNRMGFGPFARFYIKNTSRIQCFSESAIAISRTFGNRPTKNGNELVLLDTGKSFNLGMGTNIFITRKLTFESALNFNSIKITDTPRRNAVVFMFGFTGFFGGDCSDGAFY